MYPTRRHRTIALIACACALAYGLMKAWLAARGEIGILGFPARIDTSTAQIGPRQFGNAAFGFLAALIALATIAPWRRAIPRPPFLLVLWGGGLALLAGVAIIAARALGFATALGGPPTGPTGYLVAAIGLLWACSWLLMAWHYSRVDGRQG